MAKLSPVQQAKLRKIMADPVLWAKAFLVSNDAQTKKMGPWQARDYQEEMLHDKSLRKVYRCGRRTGKSETMVVEGMHKAFTNKMFRVLYVTPYENQVNLLFMRMRELIHDSPLIKREVVKMKNSPYTIEFSNGSVIMGFTTGASSGSGAASIRGQRADWLMLDELDYMGESDYSTVAMIAGERADIGITASSTPTGKRGTFYKMCTDAKMGYQEHYHPSMHNPNWCQEMEDQFRSELTPSQYDHEILAIFGTEESGVFDKDKVDLASRTDWYTYDKLSETQLRQLDGKKEPAYLDYSYENPAPLNPFRCIGVDWDQFQASSSIIVLDYDIKRKVFRVIKRVEVPRAEYTIDNAVNWVIRMNHIYNPSWIFCDRGYGDYQIERLHIYGDQHPSSGLKNKVIGYQFKNTLDIMDPITQVITKEPMKPFMVNQLVMAFDRQRLILSPFDETLHKQLIDYCVERISQSGQPVYTSVNEHFVDALGLAYLAFVLKFPDITRAIKRPQITSKMEHSSVQLGMSKANVALREISSPTANPWKKRDNYVQAGKGPNERRGDYQQWVHVPLTSARPSSSGGSSWGARSGMGTGGRSMW
jgi:replicative DNA helicase